jgi:ubiquinone/menaquinone biosynthesis C-methylase UbiE
MRRPEFIARQSGNPSGILGRILAWVMERETDAQNRAALVALEVRGDDRVLEIGFGHGRTLERVGNTLREGSIVGVDHSRDMVRLAAARCRRLIDDERVEVREASSRSLPYPDAEFDKVMAVNTIYFWSDPLEHLREVRRVLKKSGLFVLGFRPRADAAARDFPASVYTFHSADEIHSMIVSAGFTTVDVGPAPGLPSFLLARARRAE